MLKNASTGMIKREFDSNTLVTKYNSLLIRNRATGMALQLAYCIDQL